MKAANKKTSVKSKQSLGILHPIESFGVIKARAGEIRVERLEDRIAPLIPFPHRHDFFQLLIITQGKGWHEIDFHRHRITEREVFLMKPGQVHAWQLSPNIRGYVIEFTRESLAPESQSRDPIMEISASADLAILKKNDFENLKAICEVMFNEFSAKHENYEFSLQGFLSGLLFQALRGADQTDLKSSRSIVEKFKHLVDQYYHKQHRVEFYAERLNVTPKALTMHLSRTLKKSARLVIQERFILEAKRMLAYSDLSIAEIGYQLGFEDANYFTRFFRQQAKVSASLFREQVKKNKLK